MTSRKIIEIDESKCNGCGICVPSCAEGALRIIEGKARLVKDQYCDGLGACLGECPQGALKIIEREAADFDEVEALQEQKLRKNNTNQESAFRAEHAGSGCPGTRSQLLKPSVRVAEDDQQKVAAGASELRQWPVQLNLVPVKAPYYEDADLLIAADCVPFAYPNFHRQLLRNKTLLIGCPKLDETQVYLEKLTSIIKNNDLNSITIAHMEVPCCFGLVNLVKEAVKQAEVKIPVYQTTIGVNGEIKD